MSSPASDQPTPAPAAPKIPTPGMIRPRPSAPAATPVPPAQGLVPAAPSTPDADKHGRVDEQGNVYLVTADGERYVGQVPDVTAGEAMAFFTRRYDELAFDVTLLEQRIAGAKLGAEEAKAAITALHERIEGANAVGDLASLLARLDALSPLIEAQREARKAERAAKAAASKAAKEKIADEAETIAAGEDWRNGAQRMRDLLDEWRALPRLDRAADDALWKRFSSARTNYTRRRKAHFSEVHEQRDTAKAAKEKIVTQAEALSTSTDWGQTASAYRDLMQKWKSSGMAAKADDDALWVRFRAAQDVFFQARDAANAAIDAEFAANATVKEGILVEAEALLPITDLAAAKAAYRQLGERWEQAGKVPRERIRDLEGRMRAVEQAIRQVEDDAWRRSNPEARARAAATVAQLEQSLEKLTAELAKAESAGQAKKAADARSAIATREEWLVEARKALAEFGG